MASVVYYPYNPQTPQYAYAAVHAPSPYATTAVPVQQHVHVHINLHSQPLPPTTPRDSAYTRRDIPSSPYFTASSPSVASRPGYTPPRVQHFYNRQGNALVESPPSSFSRFETLSPTEPVSAVARDGKLAPPRLSPSLPPDSPASTRTRSSGSASSGGARGPTVRVRFFMG